LSIDAFIECLNIGTLIPARANNRMLKVARTIADIEGSDPIATKHLQ